MSNPWSPLVSPVNSCYVPTPSKCSCCLITTAVAGVALSVVIAKPRAQPGNVTHRLGHPVRGTIAGLPSLRVKGGSSNLPASALSAPIARA